MTEDERQYVAVLVEEAAKRLNKRTKAYKLLVKAMGKLRPPASLEAINKLFKKVYTKKALFAGLLSPMPVLANIQKVK